MMFLKISSDNKNISCFRRSARLFSLLLLPAFLLCINISNAQVNCADSIYLTVSSGQSVCAGSAANALTASIVKSTQATEGNIVYDWYSNTTNSNTGGTLIQSTTTTTATTTNSFIPSTAVAGTTWYYCIVTNDAGNANCPGISHTTQAVQVIVNPLPQVSIVSVSGTTICSGTPVTFTSDVINAGASPAYQWQVNETNVPGETGSSFTTASLTNNQRVRLIITPAGTTCALNATSNTITIAVNPLLIPGVGIAVSATSVCPGTNVTFTATPVNGGTAPAYQWKLNGTDIGSNIPTLDLSSLVSGDIVSVNVVSNAVCATPVTATAVATPVDIKPAAPVSAGTPSGNSSICPSTSGFTYSVPAVANATSYTWTVPSGWTINAGNGSAAITVTSNAAAASGNISVYASNACGSGPVSILPVTVNAPKPTSPGNITGSTSICPGVSAVYSIAAVTNADPAGYLWTVPAGWVITAGQGSTSVTVTTGNIDGNITVSASNQCGTGSPKALAVTLKPAIPASPDILSGVAIVCPSVSGLTYSVPAVANATTYVWTFPSGWNISGTTNSVSGGTFSTAVSGDITVAGKNTCGTGVPSVLPVIVNPGKPATPGTITGNTPVCPAVSAISYSIAVVANATNYTWTVPSGWTITSGQGTTGILVTSGVYGENGSITVTASNSCGTSAAVSKTVSVSVAAPPAPGSISGATELCINNSGSTYSIAAVTNATSYTWTIPAGWTVVSGANTASLKIATTASAVSGSISVVANNSCGTSAAQTLFVTVKTASPAAPATPAGATGQSSSICPVATGLAYSVASVPNASSYTWNVPAGWTITSGQGTTSIVASAGVQATGNKNINVSANNACGSNTSSTTVTIASVGTFAYVNANVDQAVCMGTGTVTLDATVAGATNANNDLTWTASAGSFSNANKPNPVFTIPTSIVASGGSVTLTVTARAEGTCPIVSDAMVVTVMPNPTVSITAVSPVCSGTSSTVTLTGTSNTTVTYKIGSGTNQTINIDNTGIAQLTTAALTTATTYSLVSIAYTSLPSCTQTASGSASIAINPVAMVNAGADAVVCASNPSVTLAGSFGGSATSASWSGGAGSFSPNNSTLAAVYTPSAAEIAAGTVTLTLTTNDPAGPCGPVTDQMVIIINPAATANANADQVTCVSSPAVTLAGAVGGGAGTGVWSGGSGSFTPNNSTLAAIYTPSAAEIAAGTVTLTLTTNDPAGPCNAVSDQMVITFNPVAVVNAGADQVLCKSSPNVSLDGKVTGSAGTGTWSGGAGTFSPDANTLNAVYIPTPAEVNAGSVTLTLTSADPAGPCPAVSDVVVITYNAVAVTTAAALNYAVCSDTTINLNGSVSGPVSTGVWSGGGGTFSPSASVLNAKYTPTAAEKAAQTVNLILTSADPAGPCPATSDTITSFVIYPEAQVSAGSSKAICSGSTATMDGFFGGGAILAVWGTSGTGTFNKNTVNAIYTPSATDITAGSVVLSYRTNDPTGPCGADTAYALLTINTVASITTQPANQSVCATNPVDISVVAAGTGLTYQWYKGNYPGVIMSNSAGISGVNSSTLHFNQGSLSDNGFYYVVVSGTAPCGSFTSNAALLSVDQQISINTQPVSKTVCQGSGAVTFSVAASASDPLLYQWRKNGVNVGTNSNTYTISNVSLTDAGTYDVVISGPATYSCASATSAPAILTVTPTVGVPVFTAGAATVCQNAADETYSASATNSTGITYSVSPSSAGTINAATGVMHWTTGFNGTVTITAIATGCNGPSSASRTVTVTPTVGTPGAVTVSSGTEPSCQLVNATTTTTYTSTAANATGYNWSLSNAAAGTINPASGLVTWANGFNGTVDIRVTANGCNGPSAQVKRTVVITPTVGVPSAITISAGTEPSCQLMNGTTTTTYSANATNATSYTWSLSSTSAGTINTSNGLLTWANNYTGTVNIRVKANGCNGPSATVSRAVTVSPSVATPVFATGSASVRCQAAEVVSYIATASNSTALSYNLDAASVAAGNSINAATGSVTYVAAWSGTSVITATAIGCNGPKTAIHTVTISPLPVGGTTSSTSNPFACSGNNSGKITLTGQTGTITKWQYSTDAGGSWTDMNITTDSYTYSNLTQTTQYRAVLSQATCPGSIAYSAATVVNVVPQTGTGSLSALANPSVICSGSSTLTALGIGSGNTSGLLSGGSFDQAGAPLEGSSSSSGLWRAYQTGSLHNIEGSANNGTNPFNLTNGPKEFFSGSPNAVTYNNNPLGGQVNNNKFMVATGPVISTLETPIFSLVGMASASIDWYEAYILESGASIKLEISTDGGNNYNSLIRPTVTGAATNGIPTNFAKTSVDLSKYAGLSNLRVRFTYTGTAYSSWGLEMASITKYSVPATYTWNLYQPVPATGTPPAHYLNVFTDTSVIVTPPTPNTTNAPVSYYYSISSSAGGCAANITVTVNPTPVITHNSIGPVCSGSALSPNITFSSNLAISGYTYTIVNPGGITGLVTNSNGTISGTPVNPGTTAQTVTIIATGTSSASCPGKPDTVTLVVNPGLTATLSGNQAICPGSNAVITLVSGGPFPFNATLSNGNTYTVTGSPFNITVSPVATTTYSITSLSGSSCAIGGTYSGNATVTASYPVAAIGTWVCGASTDWFNPCNWGGGVVPDNTINVLIPASAPCSPVIDPTSPYAPADRIARSKNITIEASRNLSFAAGKGGDLYVAGNWINNSGAAGFTANTGTVTFMGNVAQTITTATGNKETFFNLVINNGSDLNNGVSLFSDILVTNRLTLLNGIVNTHSNPPAASPNLLGLLTMTATALPVNGTPGISSFINGQMAREFTTSGAASEYAYPIGKVINGMAYYRDMAVQPTTTSATTTFTAEYFAAPPPAPSLLLGLGMVGVVPEYWQVDQSGGSANARIKIPYLNPGSGNWLGTDNYPSLDPCSSCNVAVARKDLSSNGWGFTASTGNFNSVLPEYRYYQSNGYIYSASNAVFGPFTNAFAFNVVLPVRLVSFDGKLVNKEGHLQWEVASAKDLSGFDLEYSTDGRTYAKLGTILNTANATRYGFVHRSPAPGPNYYRLLVKDIQGNSTYTKTILLELNPVQTLINGVRPNPVKNVLYLNISSAASQMIRATLLDVTGRRMADYTSSIPAGNTDLPVNTTSLPAGIYTLQVKTDDGVRANLRFVKE